MDQNNQQQNHQSQQPTHGQQPQQGAPQQQPAPQAGQPAGGQRLRIDDNMLQQIGLGQLPPQEKNRLLAQVYETLELRVGMTLANQMTDEQLKEFESFIDSKDEQGALQWLEGNFPNYKQVVAQELEKLKNEIQANAQSIIEAVNTQPSQPQQPYPAQPAQPQQQPPAYPQQQPPAQHPNQPQHQQPYDPNQPQ